MGTSDLLSNIRAAFLDMSNFLLLPENVFIASGVEEGIDGWVAANYLLGRLKVGGRLGGWGLSSSVLYIYLLELAVKSIIYISCSSGYGSD